MKRVFLMLTAGVTMFASVLTTGVATAQGQVGAPATNNNVSGSIIWQGLWNGANFNLGNLFGSPAPTPAPTPTPTPSPTPQPTPTPAPPATSGTYAALGDSVAAGLGLPAGTSPAGHPQCRRSSQAYGQTVASTMGLRLNHAACSGATAGDLFTKQGVPGPNITAQLDTAFAGGKPGLITITAGANDAHWDEFIRACYATNCSNSATTILANTYLVSLQTKLHVALQSISARSAGSSPTVILTGYYNPLSASCTQFQSNITAEEITWLTAETNALNQTIQNVSRHYSFARFSPVDFTGHDICSSSSWVQGLADPAPFHPTATGQQAIAQSVLRSLGR